MSLGVNERQRTRSFLSRLFGHTAPPGHDPAVGWRRSASVSIDPDCHQCQLGWRLVFGLPQPSLTVEAGPLVRHRAWAYDLWFIQHER